MLKAAQQQREVICFSREMSRRCLSYNLSQHKVCLFNKTIWMDSDCCSVLTSSLDVSGERVSLSVMTNLCGHEQKTGWES